MHSTPSTFDERYRAVEARDTRFDGQFVTGVRTTGIYCRPSCPARTPKPSNVTFFRTSAAAHEAGFRACKRCLPEAVPGSPEWNLRGDTVGRAMRLIADGVVEREGIGGLAARLGYSSRHLGRLLIAELGAGPLALARAHRAHTARTLLVSTDLPIADVAYSAGFGSVRQCNDTVREVFAMTPTELRARRRGADPAPGAITLLLPVREPFDAAGLLAWFAARAIPGVEQVTHFGYRRTLDLPGGPGLLELELGRQTGQVRMRASLATLADLGSAVARTRRLLDLDADPLAVDAALSRHPAIAPLIAETPGVRVPGTVDAHETLIRTMIGQQVSVASARTALTRLVAELGRPAPTRGATEQPGENTPDTLFPTMAKIAEHGDETLRGPEARRRAVTAAAAALAAGTLELGQGDDGRDQRRRLLERRGIGPWTADYVRMRVLGDPDVLLAGDSAMRAGARARGLPSDQRGLLAWAERAAPWRSYLTTRLWSETGTTSVTPRQETP
ncbi:putative 3-methyladenine DNA glycosylase AlkA [Leucobacter sp. Psy1]|uniref:DNA-3-methyladenine glycosylase 2 family protein n=1 Tax=Leucobacter sp. Psy1 TaxID=2875729 RepID=UPI001CD7E518|nr:DNA-3-methyladenine glycosylase 2 family protein [Leucobacter sp. Psy1]UBH05498.1 putative 3-methyladenine DNA glycosylase AlkA [Leucobacter sp. Psy1]